MRKLFFVTIFVFLNQAGFSQIDLSDTNPKNWWNAPYAQSIQGWSDATDIDTIFTEANRPLMDWGGWKSTFAQDPEYQSSIYNGNGGFRFYGSGNVSPFPTQYSDGDLDFLHHPDSSFTMYFLVNKIGEANNYFWIFDGAAGTSNRTLDIRYDNRSAASRSDALFIRHKNDNEYISNTSDIDYQDVLPLSTEHSVIIIYDTDSMKVWVDGVKLQSYAKNPSITPTTSSTGSTPPAWGGSTWSSGVDFNGTLGEGVIWDRAVDPDTINQYIYENYDIGSDLGLGGGGGSVNRAERTRGGRLRTNRR